MERVIVYRSQSEAMLDKIIWDNNGALVPVGIVLVSVVIAALIVNLIVLNFVRPYIWKHKQYKNRYSLIQGSCFVLLGIPLTYVLYYLIHKFILWV